MNEKIEEALARAVKASPEAMEQIRQAVQENGYALDDVPESLRGEDLCRAAVQQAGGALQFVPWPMRTQELCEMAVKKDCGALEDVPDSMKTAEMCMEAVKRDGLSLRVVPDRLKTPAMCLAALEEKGCLEDWESAAEREDFLNSGEGFDLEDFSVDFWEYVPSSMQDEVRAKYEAAGEDEDGGTPRP